MLMISMICFMVASACVAGAVCFVKDNKLAYLINNLGIALLLGSGLMTATYRNIFTGYTILVSASAAPLVLSVFRNQLFEDNQKSQIWAKLIKYIGFLVSAVALYVAMLYIGKETYYGALLGVAVALFLTFLDAIIKKTYKNDQKTAFFVEILLDFVRFASVGVVIGAITCALIYSVALPNILFAIGGFLFCGHVILNNFIENKYTHLPLYAAMIVLFISFLFI